jgi:hypothetical protein
VMQVQAWITKGNSNWEQYSRIISAKRVEEIDPPFVELGNDILAKKEWWSHFCISKSLARSRQKLNSRERSREPPLFPSPRAVNRLGHICLCPPFPYVKGQLGFFTKGV